LFPYGVPRSRRRRRRSVSCFRRRFCSVTIFFFPVSCVRHVCIEYISRALRHGEYAFCGHFERKTKRFFRFSSFFFPSRKVALTADRRVLLFVHNNYNQPPPSFRFNILTRCEINDDEYSNIHTYYVGHPEVVRKVYTINSRLKYHYRIHIICTYMTHVLANLAAYAFRTRSDA